MPPPVVMCPDGAVEPLFASRVTLMDALRELFEIATPKLDRDRLFSVVPVHLQSAASWLEYRVKEIESFFGDESDAVALCTIGLWMLHLAEDGTVPLRPNEVRLIGRVLDRRRRELCPPSTRFKMGTVPVPTFGARMVCTCCGIIGADARPNWREQPARLSGAGTAPWRSGSPKFSWRQLTDGVARTEKFRP